MIRPGVTVVDPCPGDCVAGRVAAALPPGFAVGVAEWVVVAGDTWAAVVVVGAEDDGTG
ncbi:hypothetical protein [Frankia sp. Cas3]|uniref:hypothetical protein n=1 Tax=Frankia sp. Cas3 TaxID=3073926 RepID=UPI002AD4F6F5|nr:hypothetical protein [Frankia sp. Cas3]